MMVAFLDGARRVTRAPWLVAGTFLLIVLTAVPLALAIEDEAASRLGDRVVAGSASGGEAGWWERFRTQSRGVVRTLQPDILGLAALGESLSDLLAAPPVRGPIVVTVIAYLVVWAFLIGGLLDRVARQRRVGSIGFLAACSLYVFRLCRLAVLAAAVYTGLFMVADGWMLGLVVLVINIVFEYAAIRAVVEDRRSMVGAIRAAIRFVRRRPVDVVGLYLVNSLVVLLVVAASTAMGASMATSSSPWIAPLVGQASVVVHLLATLVFHASQTAYFQRQLAHPTYVAAPRPTWTHSPSAAAVSTTTR